MSVLTDILDRLSGVAVVRERLMDTAKRVDQMSDHVLDHERRLIRIETLLAMSELAGVKRLTKK